MFSHTGALRFQPGRFGFGVGLARFYQKIPGKFAKIRIRFPNISYFFRLC